MLYEVITNSKNGSHFFVRQALPPVQDKGCPVTLRNLPERLDELFLELHPPGDPFRPPIPGARERNAVRPVPSFPRDVDRDFIPRFLFVAQVIERCAPGDSV